MRAQPEHNACTPKTGFLGGAICDITARDVDTLLGFALRLRCIARARGRCPLALSRDIFGKKKDLMMSGCSVFSCLARRGNARPQVRPCSPCLPK